MNNYERSKLKPLPESTPKETVGSEFFSFRKMVSTTMIKILYVLGSIGLIIYGIVIMANGYDVEILIGIAVILLGNLLWRILCEGWILLFSIHDVLGSIEKELKQK